MAMIELALAYISLFLAYSSSSIIPNTTKYYKLCTICILYNFKYSVINAIIVTILPHKD